jgi:quercetin dioxygenase-like cupin family protein
MTTRTLRKLIPLGSTARRAPWLAALALACAGPQARPSLVPPDGGEAHVIFAQGRQTPITLKVDPVTTGSDHFVMGTAEIARGSRVPTHRHNQDELIFVHHGTPRVTLGDTTKTVQPGTTVFIPQGTWIGLENVADETVVFVWVFARPEFERWVREISLPAGAPLVEKPAAEVRIVNDRYHMVFR